MRRSVVAAFVLTVGVWLAGSVTVYGTQGVDIVFVLDPGGCEYDPVTETCTFDDFDLEKAGISD